MIYYIIHESSGLQIFKKNWTSSKAIFKDLTCIKKMFDIEEIDNFIIHDNKYRFKICYDLNGYLQCGLIGRYFYTDTLHGRSFVINDFQEDPIRVFNNFELTKCLGFDINEHHENA